MKSKLGTITTLSFLLVLAAVSVNAQQLSESKITVNIPFEFVVGETTFPAGQYSLLRIVSNSSADQLLIRSEDRSVDTPTGITRPNRGSEIQKRSSLVFNRYGDQYFLSQVWTAGSDTGRELFRSRSERNLAKQVARSKSKPSKVTLTAAKG
jgi:hypothetical protein